ncbi:hypothetical protein WA158_000629 [Blastocystis sp. Blastoise]
MDLVQVRSIPICSQSQSTNSRRTSDYGAHISIDDISTEEFKKKFPRKISMKDIELNKSYGSNKITSTRYNIYNFILLFLWDCFNPRLQFGNFFFLIIMIIQCIKPISLTNGLPTSSPALLFVIIAEGIHIAFREREAHDTNNIVNHKQVLKYSNINGNEEWILTNWKDLYVGDIIRIQRDEEIPADIYVINTSKESSIYISTANINGETSPNKRDLSIHYSASSLQNNGAIFYVEDYNSDIYDFKGYVAFENSAGKYGQGEYIDKNRILYRGSKLEYTEYIEGVCITVGINTKIEYTSRNKPQFKRGTFPPLQSLLYISIVNTSSYIYNYYIPLYPSPYLLNTDGNNDNIKVHNIYMASDLGVITHVISDKTGTITKNNLTVESLCFGTQSVDMIHKDDSHRDTIDTLSLANQMNDYLCSESPEIPQTVSICLNLLLNHDAFFIQQIDKCEEEEETVGISITSSNDITSDIYTINDDTHNDNNNNNIENRISINSNNSHGLLYDEENKPRENGRKLCFSSKDEEALVTCLSSQSLAFEGSETQIEESTNNSQKKKHIFSLIQSNNLIQKIEFLFFFPFSTERKRTSILVRIKNHIYILTKGADSTIFPLLNPLQKINEYSHGNADPTSEYYSTLSNITIFLRESTQKAHRVMVFAERELSMDEYSIWKSSLELPDNPSPAEMLILERDLLLTGAVSIEDDLADGVPATFERLRLAGIKTWIITGDKGETARAIAISSSLISPNESIYMLTKDNLINNIQELNVVIKTLPSSSLSLSYISSNSHGDMNVIMDSFPSSLPLYTLAIGDGGNDVGMIQQARIGVGIRGENGFQAALASDYEIHGRNAKRGVSKLLLYMLYKNIAQCLLAAFYVYLCIYTSFSLLPRWGVDMFNTFYTSLPIMFITLFDEDIHGDIVLHIPELYKPSWNPSQLSTCSLFLYVASSLFIAAMHIVGSIFCLPSTSYSDISFTQSISFSHLGLLQFSTLVYLESCYSSLYISLCIFASIALFIACYSIISAIYYFPGESVSFAGIMPQLFWHLPSLLTILLLIYICIFRDLLWKFIRHIFIPYPLNIEIYDKSCGITIDNIYISKTNNVYTTLRVLLNLYEEKYKKHNINNKNNIEFQQKDSIHMHHVDKGQSLLLCSPSSSSSSPSSNDNHGNMSNNNRSHVSKSLHSFKEGYNIYNKRRRREEEEEKVISQNIYTSQDSLFGDIHD